MYEHIPGLWKRTCGETLSQNRTECLHAPQTTRQRGEFGIFAFYCALSSNSEVEAIL